MMKRTVLLLVVALSLLSTSAIAQRVPQFGLRAGGNLAQLRGTDNVFGKDATDRKLGFTLGVFAELPLSTRLSVQPELLYTQKGGSVDALFLGEDLGGTAESDFNLNYVKLPVLARYAIPTGRRVMPSLYAGPYVAYSVKRSIHFDLKSVEGEDLGISFDADEAFKRMDYGAVFGVDFGYRIARRATTLGVRYNLGLANVFKDDIVLAEDDEPIALGDAKARTHEFSVVLGVTLF